MKRYIPDIVAFGLIAILALIFFWKFFFPVPQLLVTPDFGRSDAWHFSFPTKYFLSQSLKQNRLPLWSSNLGGGFPLLAEGQTGTFFLPNLIFYKFLDPVIAYNFTLLLVPITIGWGMYVWLRMLKFDPLASLFGGITMAFSGPVMTELPHITLLQGFSLLPWIMVATHVLAQKKSWRWATILAFVVSQQLLAGFPQASVITMLFAAGYFFWLTRKTIFLDCIRFGIVLLLALGLSAVQLLPSFEFLQNSTARGGFSPQDAAYFSYPLKHLVTFLNPFGLGNPKFATYPPFTAFDGSIFWENTGFIGILPLIFFLASFWQVSQRARPESQRDAGQASMTGPVTFFLISLFISFFLMLGSHSPFYIVYSFWPFNLFRVPSRFLWIFVTSLVMISVMGIQLFIRRGITSIVLVVILGFQTFFLINTWKDYHAIEPAKNWLAPPPITKFLTPHQNVYTIGSETAHNQSFLIHGWQDIRPYEFLRNTIAPDSNLLWNIPSSQVYAGRFLRRQALVDTLLSQFILVDPKGATISGQAKKLLDIFSVQQIVSAVPLTQEGLTITGSVNRGGITMQVYKNEQSLPRVYLARDSVVAQTFEESMRKIQEATFILGKSILVEQIGTSFWQANQRARPESQKDAGQASMTERQDDGIVSIMSESDTTIAIAVRQNTTPAVLVLTDTFYPGWHASIDGKKTALFPVNIRHRGVIVDSGDHTITFQFAPQSFTIGVWITAATILFIGVGFLLSFLTARTHQKVSAQPLNRRRNHDR